MKKRIAKLWVKALRSEQYNQGMGRLATTTKDGDEFCCLGVLCNEYAYSTVGKAAGAGWEKYGTTDSTLKMSEDIYGLPDEVLDWAEIGGRGGLDCGVLAAVNDDGQSFKQIADLIEKNWKEL